MRELVKSILMQEQIKFNNIKKSDSGFSNLVCFVDDLYVIKILESNGNKTKFLNEVGFYKNISFDFIPKYITSGIYKETHYLIIEKLKGKPLYDIWHTLTKEERNDITKQIALILKEFNAQSDYSFLDQKYIRPNSIKLWQNAFRINIDILSKRGYDTELLTEYMNNQVPIIFKEDKLGLVYNDAHFDNFIYDVKNIKLIDFDRVLYCSIDYELLILTTMINNPRKFANEATEPFVEIKDYIDILTTLKNEYPELFDFEYLEDRLFIYSFFYMLGNAYEFDLEWLIQECVNKFRIKFYNKDSE